MTLEEKFQEAGVRVRTLTSRPSNEDLLTLYALFKQATEGDVSGTKPGMFDFKGLAKYNSWELLKGLEADEARQQYVDKVDAMMAAATS